MDSYDCIDDRNILNRGIIFLLYDVQKKLEKEKFWSLRV